MARTEWWALALAGCTYLSDDDLAQRLDLDGDGVAEAEDCDPNDGERFDTVDAFADDDGDGAGDPLTAQTFCGPPPVGWVTNALDQCPDNAELTSPALWWEDLDGDGFGNPDASYSDCESTPAVERAYPGNPDCDDTDPAATGVSTWYIDADGDGVGALETEGIEGCGPPPEGYATVPGDECDDEPALTQRLRYFVDADLDGEGGPDEEELCAVSAPVGWAVDDADCDDDEPRLSRPVDYFVDGDGDAFGSEQSDPFCSLEPPAGYAIAPDDCNDDNDAIYPGRPEQCDGVDQDCDFSIDEELYFAPYYVDADDDGYPSTIVENLCRAEPLYILVSPDANPTDCDDDNSAIHPDAPEQYGVTDDGIDHDCNPLNDRDADLDGADRYGLDGPIDCDDTRDDISPFLVEIYDDGIDNDCSPATSDLDFDLDGYDRQPEGTDCDDTDPLVHPDQVELVEALGAGIDDNCSGGVGALCGRDDDGDGFGGDELLVADIDPSDSCVGALSLGGVVLGAPGDCDDDDDTVSPGAREVCDGIDSNCDGDADSRLITLFVDDEEPVTLQEGVQVIDTDGTSVRVDVCSDNDEDPLALALDIQTASDVTIEGRWTGGPVKTPVPDEDPTGEIGTINGIPVTDADDIVRPLLGPVAGGQPILALNGGGRVSLAGLDMSNADVDVLSGELLVTDSTWTDVHTAVGSLGTADDAVFRILSGARVLGTTSFDVVGGRLDISDVLWLSDEVPFVVASDGAVVVLDGITVADAAQPLVQATGGSSVTAIGMASSEATVPLFELDLSQLTDVASIYEGHASYVYDATQSTMIILDAAHSQGAGVLVADGGSTLVVGGEIASHGGEVLFDTVDHDVSLIDRVMLTDVAVPDGVPFLISGADLTLRSAELDACPLDGLADVTGELTVEDLTLACDAEAQTAPLFDVVGDVTLRSVTLDGATALPPRALAALDGRVVLFDVGLEGIGMASADDAAGPALLLDGVDATLERVKVVSKHCSEKPSGCTDVTAVEAVDSVVRALALETATQGIGVDLLGESFYGHGGGTVVLGNACATGETQTHDGPVAVQLEAAASMNMYGCADKAEAVFGSCPSEGSVVLVDCPANEPCRCSLDGADLGL